MQDASVNATVIGEGLAILEARVTLKTDDAAFIHAAWSGRAYLSEGLVAIAPTFRTANDSYTWLNRVQAVGAGEEDLAAGSFRLTVPITRIKLDSGSTRFAMFRSLLKERRPGSRVRVPRCFRLTLWCLFGTTPLIDGYLLQCNLLRDYHCELRIPWSMASRCRSSRRRGRSRAGAFAERDVVYGNWGQLGMWLLSF
jgi:hypothetical protein